MHSCRKLMYGRLAPGIIVMQFTTIFFPAYEIWRSRSQMRTTLAILRHWETRRDAEDSKNHLMSSSTSRTSHDRPSTIESTESSRRHKETCSMASLETALAMNPDPLLRFAATKDFTAENILFLIQVRSWREAFESAPRINSAVTEVARTHLFNSAVQIYISRVNDRTTAFPINIESKTRHELDTIFSPAVPTGHFVHRNEAEVFGSADWTKSPIGGNQRIAVRTDSYDSQSTLFSGAAAAAVKETLSYPAEKSDALFQPHPCVAPLGESRATIRAGFDEHVFDAAERSIKYLVLTNTWQKFVKFGEHHSNLSSSG